MIDERQPSEPMDVQQSRFEAFLDTQFQNLFGKNNQETVMRIGGDEVPLWWIKEEITNAFLAAREKEDGARYEHCVAVAVERLDEIIDDIDDDAEDVHEANEKEYGRIMDALEKLACQMDGEGIPKYGSEGRLLEFHPRLKR